MTTQRTILVYIFCGVIIGTFGFSPYFHYGPNLMIKKDADNYCKSVGMKTIKIDMDALNSMTADFILSKTFTDDAWLALDCTINPCKWDETGKDLGWSVWGNAQEPIYPCVSIVIFDQPNMMKWKSVPCSTPLRPLCYAPPKPNYEMLFGAYNFHDASLACIDMGGQLAVLTDPVSMAISKDAIQANMPGGLVWIGLYGNGTALRWQNKNLPLGLTDWSVAHPIPGPTDDVAVLLDPVDGTWVARPKFEFHPNVLCQYNYMPVGLRVDYATANKGCKQYALDLALLHTEEEVTVANSAIFYQGIGTAEDLWIGLTSPDGVSFRWNDGRELTMNLWVSLAPITPISTYPAAVLDLRSHREFDNRKTADGYYYICQYPTDNDYPISRFISENFSPTTSQPPSLSSTTMESSTLPPTTIAASTFPSTTTESTTFPTTTLGVSTFPSTTTLPSTTTTTGSTTYPSTTTTIGTSTNPSTTTTVGSSTFPSTTMEASTFPSTTTYPSTTTTMGSSTYPPTTTTMGSPTYPSTTTTMESTTFPPTTMGATTFPSTTTYPSTTTTMGSSTYPSTTTTMGSSTNPSTTSPIVTSSAQSSTAGMSTPLPPAYGNGVFEQRLFTMDRTDSIPSDSPYHVISGCTKMSCASFCLSDANMCSVFAYEFGQCSLYATYNSGSVSVAMGTSIYA